MQSAVPRSSASSSPSTSAAAAAGPLEGEVITHGALCLDLDGFSVRVEGQDVPVTLTEFLILKELAAAPYRTIDRGSLAAAVKGRSLSLDLRPISARTVDLHISRLRRKLLDAGCDCIRTMRFVGYRFVPNL